MNTNETAAIAEIHEQDVAEARALLRDAIRTAGARWLPMNAIADALARELATLRGQAPCVVPDGDRTASAKALTIYTWQILKRS
mgnify:CR=1 FL=1